MRIDTTTTYLLETGLKADYVQANFEGADKQMFYRRHSVLRAIAKKAFQAASWIPCVRDRIAQKVGEAAFGNDSREGKTLDFGVLFDMQYAPVHDMNNHVFTEAIVDGGRLYYDGDLPVLEITTSDPFEAGFTHGKLVAPQFKVIKDRWELALYDILGLPGPEQLDALLDAVWTSIPSEYQKEMEGLVAGYNSWADENGESQVTLKEIFSLHLTPERSNYLPLQGRGDDFSHSCSTIIDVDADQGMVMGRNFDYPTMGLSGAYSLIINRKREGKKATFEVAFPGICGTFTGINQDRVMVSQNASPDQSTQWHGIPSLFLNRQILENCSSFAEAALYVQEHVPFAAYHLSVADRGGAGMFHMHQGMTTDEKVQHFLHQNWREYAQPLVSTNLNFSATNYEWNKLQCLCPRENKIRRLFNETIHALGEDKVSKAALIEAAINMPFVTNDRTLHKIFFYPDQEKAKIGFDNGFVSKDCLQEVQLDRYLDSH